MSSVTAPDDLDVSNSLGLGLSRGGSRVGLAYNCILGLLERGLPGRFSSAPTKDYIVLTESRASRQIQPLISQRAALVGEYVMNE
jgi:hypothetical protein